MSTAIALRYLSRMPTRNDVAWTQLATRIPDRLRRAIKVHCVQKEQSVMDLVAEAITEKLTRDASRPRRSVK